VQATREKNGVRNPKPRNTDTKAAHTISQCTEFAGNRAQAFRKNVPATEKRRSKRAAPGPPCGNIENKRCTGIEWLLAVQA
jgi:hypothetical protein